MVSDDSSKLKQIPRHTAQVFLYLLALNSTLDLHHGHNLYHTINGSQFELTLVSPCDICHRGWSADEKIAANEKAYSYPKIFKCPDKS